MQVLLVEDNEMVAKGLLYTLKQNGYEPIHKANIKDTKAFLQNENNKEKTKLVILDISLPDGDGFTLYEEDLKDKNIPTIFLTAKDEEDDVVKGLELGAEDYITKPFSTRELMARINKIILKGRKNLIVKVKDIEFDLDKMVIYKNEKEIVLTSLELKILHLLFTNLNRVVARNDIIEKIWEWTGNDVNDNTVTVYLKRIRKKVGCDIITTVKGIGYRVDKEE